MDLARGPQNPKSQNLCSFHPEPPPFQEQPKTERTVHCTNHSELGAAQAKRILHEKRTCSLRLPRAPVFPHSIDAGATGAGLPQGFLV